MRPITRAVGIAVLCALPLPMAVFAQEEVLDNEDIVNLTEAGLPAAVIVAKIESTATAFDTTSEELVALVQRGVHADVLAAMAKASASTAAASEPPPDEAGRDAPPAERPLAAPEPVSRASWRTGARFSDALNSGGRGPEMVVLPAGSFYMGCVSGMGCSNRERPIREVSIAEPFAASIHEVRMDEYDRFTAATGRSQVDDGGWGRGGRPAVNVSWSDAKEYVAWLSRETGGSYRLLTEAEWEYAARLGSTTQFHFGDHPMDLCRYANHADVSLPSTSSGGTPFARTGSPSRRPKSGATRRTRGDFTTCTATPGNGSRTAGTERTRTPPPTAAPGRKGIAFGASCAGVPGTTGRPFSGPRAGTVSALASAA